LSNANDRSDTATRPPDDAPAVARPTLAERLTRLFARPAPGEDGAVASRTREAEERFDVLFASCREGLLLCDEHGAILDCNAAAVDLLGEPRERVVGALLRAYFKQDDQPLQIGLLDGEARAYRNRRWPFQVEVRVAATRLGGRLCSIVHLRDLREQHSRLRAQDRMARMASVDELTNLPNRAQFRACLARAMERARRHGQPMALMFLDLDRFKVVNDSLGHEAGDRLLQHVARTLTATLRGADIVGRAVDPAQFTLSRLGGDEFTVIAEAVGSPEDAGLLARRMLEALAAPIKLGHEEVVASASIGISMYPTDDVDLDALIRHADMAMYRSKALGRNTFAFYSDDLDAVVTARLSLEGSLRRALERDEFLLHYQPKACLKTGQVTGVEALLRWEAPGRGMVPPDRFIAVLEDTGLIVQIGAWVLRTACADLAAWDRQGLPPLRMAVNLSARQFRQPHLCPLISETLREHGLAPDRLELELTESLLMEDNEMTRGMLAGFARIGVGVAIDDFGTGHSSLAYLKRFNVDTLKIDRSFVKGLPDSPEDAAIARAVVALGRTMHMHVVAEGVETDGQAAYLKEIGCDEIQGYLLSPPKPPRMFEDWLHGRLRRANHAPLMPPGVEAAPPAAPAPTAHSVTPVAMRAPAAVPSPAAPPKQLDDQTLQPLTLAFETSAQPQPVATTTPVYWLSEPVVSVPDTARAGGRAPLTRRAGWQPRTGPRRPAVRAAVRRRGPGSAP
jgi:diguanylate cyclase (GGDEF)-like protein